MRDVAQGVRLLLAAAVSVSVIVMGQTETARSDNPAGHAIADKFANDGAAEARKRSKAKRDLSSAPRPATDGRDEEADMLARARSEADARRREQDRERAAAEEADRHARDAARLEEERVAGEAKRRDEENLIEAARRADEERRIEDARKAEEQRRAAAAKADEDRRIEEARRATAEALRLEEERQARELAAEQERRRAAEALAEQERRRAAEARRASEEAVREARRQADEKSRLAADTDKLEKQAAAATQAAERDLEARRITEALSDAAIARTERDRARIGSAAPEADPRYERSPPASPLDSYSRDVPVRFAQPQRVAVLLVMEPGDRGIRRHNKTADPLLCTNGGCYVSNGPGSAARFMPGRKALGLGRTLGERAGACSNSLGCVFRDVELGSLPALVQPIDMRLVRHDRRPSHHVDGPSDCRLDTGRLQCRQTIDGGSYLMWIVPEDVASRAGPDLLERAIADGLPASQTAALAR